MKKRLLPRSVFGTLLALGCVLPLAASPAQAQDWAKKILDKSPRHQQWVKIHNGNRTIDTFVVYPEVKAKAPVIVLIHEIFGLSDWARSMADDLAAAGYIVVAPDLLSGEGPNGGGSSTFADRDARVKAVSQLDPIQVISDLNAAADWGMKQPAANGKLAVVGFCWGGGKSFAFATQRKDLTAAFVFYGTTPPELSGITAPVYGFYAGNDARISATVPATREAMKAAGKKYDAVIYDGAGHGFMRAGEDPDNTNPANVTARKEGLKRLERLLKSM
ncbi:MAG TPA: dienelactone hydrolase family protein [Terracidiphilus sp.]|nr:dienelactone hydrolase family protein [Terracidiphilus sp.]